MAEYTDKYSSEIISKFVKLKKKDNTQYKKVIKKINQILDNPNLTYKYLRYTLKGVNRVHIGSFVLIFIINHNKKTIYFEDYDHHDKIYL